MLKLLAPKVLRVADGYTAGQSDSKYRLNVIPINVGLINLIDDFFDSTGSGWAKDAAFKKWMDNDALCKDPLKSVLTLCASSDGQNASGSSSPGNDTTKVTFRSGNSERSFYVLNTSDYLYESSAEKIESLHMNRINHQDHAPQYAILAQIHMKWYKEQKSKNMIRPLFDSLDGASRTFLDLATLYRNESNKRELFAKSDVAFRNGRNMNISNLPKHTNILSAHFKRSQKILVLQAIASSLNTYVNNTLYPNGMSSDEVNLVYSGISNLSCSIKCCVAIAIEYMLNGSSSGLCDTWAVLLGFADISAARLHPNILCGIPVQSRDVSLDDASTKIISFRSKFSRYKFIVTSEVSSSTTDILTSQDNRIELIVPIASRKVLILVRVFDTPISFERTIPFINSNGNLIYKRVMLSRHSTALMDDMRKIIKGITTLQLDNGSADASGTSTNKIRRCFRNAFEPFPSLVYAQEFASSTKLYTCFLYSVLSKQVCEHIQIILTSYQTENDINMVETVLQSIISQNDIEHDLTNAMERYLKLFVS